MKKLRLDLTSLRVETFRAVEDGASRNGTVFGYVTRVANGCAASDYPPECSETVYDPTCADCTPGCTGGGGGTTTETGDPASRYGCITQFHTGCTCDTV